MHYCILRYAMAQPYLLPYLFGHKTGFAHFKMTPKIYQHQDLSCKWDLDFWDSFQRDKHLKAELIQLIYMYLFNSLFGGRKTTVLQLNKIWYAFFQLQVCAGVVGWCDGPG